MVVMKAKMILILPGLDGLTATRLLKAGFDGYLPKPIDTKGFLNLVARLLRDDFSESYPKTDGRQTKPPAQSLARPLRR